MGHLGKAGTPDILKQLGVSGTKLTKQTRRPRNLALRRLTEALQGKAGPQVRQAVASSRQQMATGLQQTAEQLAQRNVGGPFASSMLAGQRLAGEQQISMIPTQMMEQTINQMLPFLASTQSLGVGAMGGAAQMQSQLDQFNAQQKLAVLGALAKSASPSIGGLLGGSK